MAAMGMSKQASSALKYWRGTSRKERGAKGARQGEGRQPEGRGRAHPPERVVEEQMRQPEERLHQRRVLVVVVPGAHDGRVRQRPRGLAHELPEPGGVVLGGVEVEALVAGEAHGGLGGPQRAEGQHPEPQGEPTLLACRGAASCHGPSREPSAKTSRHTWRDSGLSPSFHTFTVRGSPGGRTSDAFCTPSSPGGTEMDISGSWLRASSTPRCVTLRRGARAAACSKMIPPSSRSSVPAGTPSNSATSRCAPPGGCIHRQWRGS